jgi:hypothetical protein
MNLPSSLALPQSKLFQSRTGILVLLLVLVLAGAGVYFFLQHPLAPPKSPTVATSPAAVATPRVSPRPVTAVPPPVVYGPPAPDWVVRQPVLPSSAPAGAAAVMPAPAVALPATASAAGAASIASQLATPVSSVAGVGVEAPQSLDASVLFAREQYIYMSGDRRDPFQSLLDGRYQSATGDGALVDVGDIHLVGIMWGAADKFALVEDSRGRGFVLRVGDPVVNGYISGISKSELQVVQNAFGDTQTLSIQLKPKEGDTNATRK